MKTRLSPVVLAAAAMIFFAPLPEQANANTLVNKGACNKSHRITHSATTCLSAEWSRRGDLGGSNFSAENLCSQYGTVKAHVDLKNGKDKHFVLDEPGAMGGGHDWLYVNDISCCTNKSDLCYKQEVKAEEGEIILFDPPIYSTHDVSTHWARYTFCQQHADSIYCENDPEGDAFTEPDTPVCSLDESCNCGDHYCTAADCDDEWNEHVSVTSDALLDSDCANSDHTEYSSSIDAEDGTSQTCTIRTACGSGNRINYFEGEEKTTTTRVHVVEVTRDIDLLDELIVCGRGQLKVPNCHGTTVSTEISTYEIAVPDEE